MVCMQACVGRHWMPAHSVCARSRHFRQGLQPPGACTSGWRCLVCGLVGEGPARAAYDTLDVAAQALKAVIPKRETADVVTALPPWIYMYRKLIMDPSRAVRSETAAVLAVLLGAVGKAVAPHLKALMGPCWLAQHDPHADAAAATRSAFQVRECAARRRKGHCWRRRGASHHRFVSSQWLMHALHGMPFAAAARTSTRCTLRLMT